MSETRRRRSLVAVFVVVCLATASFAALAHPHGHGAVRIGARCASGHFAQETAADLTVPPPVVALAPIGVVAEPAAASTRSGVVSTAAPRAPPFV